MRIKEKIAEQRVCFRKRVVVFIVSSLFLITGRAADLDQGEELFEEHCAACHTVIKSVRDKSGPNLNGVFGRKAGTEDYSGGYSEEMIASGLIWEMGTLQAFVNSPAMVVRGTKMVFRGLPNIEARIDLTCYLNRVTGNKSVGSNELCAEVH